MKSFGALKEEFETITSIIDVEKQRNILIEFFETIYPDIKSINYKRKAEDIVQVGIMHITPFEKDRRTSYDREFGCYTGTKGKRGISNLNDYTSVFLRNELSLMYKIPYNSYYSLGLHRLYTCNEIDDTFDYDPDPVWDQIVKEEYKKNGKKLNLKHFRATKKNTVFLGILAIDIDADTPEKLLVEIDKADEIEKSLGITSLRINTSKNGQQRIYLLDKLYTDMTLQKQFTKSFYEVGVNVDAKIIDSSRLLRLPCSIHTKAFNSKKHNELFLVEWENSNEDFERYDPYILIEKLNTLKIRDFVDKDNSSNKKIIKIKEKKEEKEHDFDILKEQVSKSLLTDEELQEIYNCIDINEVPEPIKLLLSHIPEGFRNIGIRAVHYFLEFDYPFQLSENNKRFILVELARRLNDLDLLYQANYFIDNKQYIKLTKENDLVKIFGKYEHPIKVGKTEDIMISNILMGSFRHLKGRSFEAFMKLLIYEAESGIKIEYMKDELIGITSMGDKSLERYLKDLVKAKLLIKKKARNRKNGDVTRFYINPLYRDIKMGYEKMGLKHMEMIIEKLNSNELKLYCYFLLKIKEDEEFRKSQELIAVDLDVDRTTITKLTNSLNKKGFLSKSTEGNGFYKTTIYKMR